MSDATFDKSRAADVAAVKKGQQITVVGIGDGKVIGARLKGSSIVK